MQKPTAHWVWDMHEGVDSFKDFCELIAKPFILPLALLDNLREELLVVHKLLQHAYFECRFIDIALLQTAVLFEKVLKNYYQEVEGKAYKGNLRELINHFVSREHFEFSNANDLLHIYRDIRNRKVHDLDSPNGLLMIRGVYRMINFINDLYEDKNLRKQRAEETKQLQSILDELVSGGASLEIKEDSFVLLYDAKVLFINNKKKPAEIAIAFWPKFSLKPYLDGVHHYKIKPLVKKVHSPSKLSNNVLELTDQADQKIRLNGQLNEAFDWMHKSWLKKAHSLPNLRLVMHTRYSALGNTMEEIITDFYSTSH